MYRIIAGGVLTALGLLSMAVAAESHIRPGLWEVSTTSDLLLLAPYIREDQMRELQDLAKEYGVDMPHIENGAATSTTCITQEMAKSKIIPGAYQSQWGCAVKKAVNEGSRYQVQYQCSSEQLNGTGTVEGIFSTDESFTGQTTFNGTFQGNPVNERAGISGQWLKADCGNIKPLQQ